MRIHVIGICGTAMATLAAMLKARGHDVQGSDLGVYPPMSDFLAREEISAFEGYRADGVVRASFRFDSLTRGGREAWISLEGSLHRDRAARDLPAGTRTITAGTMRGMLVVDRQRAWIVDARTVMDVQSEVSGTTPVILDLRITQRVKVR